MDSYGKNFQTETEGENSFSIQSLPSSRRTKSLSSSLSSSSSFGSLSFDSPLAPNTIHQFSSGIPFSWEKQPGIPKISNHSSKKKDASLILLPLPPAPSPNSSKRFNFEALFSIWKKNSTERLLRDPFVAALMECSKNQDDELVDSCLKNAKSSRTLSHKLSLIDRYASCKRTCAVTESTILLPRSRGTSYDLLNRRSS